ncbi:hypothetical protein HDU96_007831 [Phlyctochytrium bullatum]|nr:hypothetical protein HDU96_007831 [Phlyctochytrium bullatum]
MARTPCSAIYMRQFFGKPFTHFHHHRTLRQMGSTISTAPDPPRPPLTPSATCGSPAPAAESAYGPFTPPPLPPLLSLPLELLFHIFTPLHPTHDLPHLVATSTATRTRTLALMTDLSFATSNLRAAIAVAPDDDGLPIRAPRRGMVATHALETVAFARLPSSYGAALLLLTGGLTRHSLGVLVPSLLPPSHPPTPAGAALPPGFLDPRGFLVDDDAGPPRPVASMAGVGGALRRVVEAGWVRRPVLGARRMERSGSSEALLGGAPTAGEAGEGVDLCAEDGFAFLVMAWADDAETLDALLAVAKADSLDATEPSGDGMDGMSFAKLLDTVGLCAARHGSARVLALLLSHRHRLRSTGFTGRLSALPLVVASQHGWTAAVSTLLGVTGADEVCGDDVEEALRRAAAAGHAGVVETLLATGLADAGKVWDRAVRDAAACGHTEVVRLLLDPRGVGGGGGEAGAHPLRLATLHRHPAVVRVLLAQGLAVDPQPALAVAARSGDPEILRMLLETGRVDAGADHQHAVRWLSALGHAAGLEVLLQMAGRRVEVGVESGYPVRMASYYGHVGVVKVLLGAGADPTVEEQFAVRTAAMNGHAEVVRMLLEHEVEVVEPGVGGSQGVDVASSRVETTVTPKRKKVKPVDPTARDHFALRKAAENGHDEVVRVLLASGQMSDAACHAAMTLAVRSGRVGVVKLLLDHIGGGTGDAGISMDVLPSPPMPPVRAGWDKKGKGGVGGRRDVVVAAVGRDTAMGWINDALVRNHKELARFLVAFFEGG